MTCPTRSVSDPRPGQPAVGNTGGNVPRHGKMTSRRAKETPAGTGHTRSPRTRRTMPRGKALKGRRLIGATDLDELADEIRALESRAREAAQTLLEHRLEIGRLLTEAKEALPHGAFENWVEQEF